MATLRTDRLRLIPLTRRMIEARLGGEGAFEREYRLDETPVRVTFPAEWPGEAIAMFPGALRRLGSTATEVEGSFVAVTADGHTAIGQLGTKGEWDETGAQEIGYGFIPDSWGQGFATEAVAALTRHLLQIEAVRAVAADTAVGNLASQRVLEKTGFERTGTGWSAEDGALIRWRLERSTLDDSARGGHAASPRG